MKQNRSKVQAWIGLSEGGYVNNPKDPGGATDRGITQRTYDAWNKQNNRPVRSVRGISKEEAETIIFEQYMKPVGFDELPNGLDYAMADYSVNSGPARAVKELQRIVGVSADGINGPKTQSAVKAKTVTTAQLRSLIIELCNRRMAFLKVAKHPKTGALLWNTFGTGWKRRVMGEQDGVQDRDTGVIDRAVKMAANETVSSPVKVFASAKAPEPDAPETVAQDPASVGTVVSGAGVLTAAGAILGPLGNLHPVAQGIAVVGLVVALLAGAYVMRARVRDLVARL